MYRTNTIKVRVLTYTQLDQLLSWEDFIRFSFEGKWKDNKIKEIMNCQLYKGKYIDWRIEWEYFIYPESERYISSRDPSIYIKEIDNTKEKIIKKLKNTLKNIVWFKEKEQLELIENNLDFNSWNDFDQFEPERELTIYESSILLEYWNYDIDYKNEEQKVKQFFNLDTISELSWYWKDNCTQYDWKIIVKRWEGEAVYVYSRRKLEDSDLEDLQWFIENEIIF